MSTSYPAFPTNTVEGIAGFFCLHVARTLLAEVTNDITTAIPVYPETTHDLS